ncbi:DEAD/DEAH box helicase [Amaricoccus solimangrovi]|uniref:DEAD/DEAH box helicase n=1 Tax=Amaricoccus solimangrovi TaxID=2589815 RepID=UPI001F3E54A2|nr:DEAD/DEAH box helicase [Amaricoccus solimangrovi]
MTDTTFAAFGLAEPLVHGLQKAGFTTPTPIQAQAIGPQLEGRDILGVAQTGTGKTAAFGLPILHQLLALKGRPAPRTCRALILAPTRELAVQIEQSLRAFAGGARISTLLVLGGLSRGGQVRALSRGVDIVIATPGRLTDLIADGSCVLDQTRFVVLDEADRMLDMGFIQPVRRIVAALHPRRQSALFSATMPDEVRGLAESFLKDPVTVSVTPESTTVERIDQSVELVDGPLKRARLATIVGDPDVSRVIVFARTKRGADRVAENLAKDGIPAEAIHGNKAQNARQRALGAFRDGRVRVLVATDIVARGIDVPGVSHVVNYDLPDEPESYVHRIGRTGRNGAEGIAITLCAPDEVKKLRAVEKITRTRLLPASVEGVPERKQPRRGGGNGHGVGHHGAGQGRGRGPKPAMAEAQDAPARPRGRGPRRPRRAA